MGGSVFSTLKISFAATANAIYADTDYIGDSPGSSDDDYFVTTASGSSMTINLNHLTQNAANSDFTVYIYYYAGTTRYDVGTFSASDGIGNSKTVGVVSGRTYYVQVYTPYYNDYWYKLRVTFP